MHSTIVVRCSLSFFLSFFFWHSWTFILFSMQDHRQFKQRYYEFLDYYRAPKGPIFLYICGESSCNGIPNSYLAVSMLKYIVVQFPTGAIRHYLLHILGVIYTLSIWLYFTSPVLITYTWDGLCVMCVGDGKEVWCGSGLP